MSEDPLPRLSAFCTPSIALDNSRLRSRLAAPPPSVQYMSGCSYTSSLAGAKPARGIHKTVDYSSWPHTNSRPGPR
jgi:hypothetical protein